MKHGKKGRFSDCSLFWFNFLLGQQKGAAGREKGPIYQDGWIDFNKNGVKDIFEDPAQHVERRILDLLGQMSLEEKTCQTATLYGYGRVLKDELPTPEWKSQVWKDGRLLRR